MGKTLVAIVGAGWKPCDVANAANGVIPPRVPTLLCPITRDSTVTILDRYVKQFNHLGITDFIAGIGAPDVPTGYIEELHWERFRVRAAGRGTPVWTSLTQKYVESYGIETVLMPNPHDKGENQYTTLIKMRDAIFAREWDNVIMVPGDYVFTAKWLRMLVKRYLHRNVYLSFWPKHDMLMADRKGFRRFMLFVESRIPVLQKRVYLDRAVMTKDYSIKVKEWEINEYRMWFDRWIEFGGSTIHYIYKLVEEDPA